MTSFRGEDAGALTRWNANMEALQTLKDIEATGREPTEQERAAMRRFAGFGDTEFNAAFEQTTRPEREGQDGLRRAYSRDNVQWAERGDELRDLLTPEEYSSIKDSRRTAFFTNPEIIRTMWEGVESLGADDLPSLRVLEPSAGSGRFITGQPSALRDRTEWTAVERDELTGRLLRAQMPDVRVQIRKFEETQLPDDGYDVAISNIPFSSIGVHDPQYLRAGKGHLTNSTHGYFFAKAMDKVRPGGIIAFVTSRFFLDSTQSNFREHIAREADLVGAVRLPAGAFPDTTVLTDIVYLRKRLPGEEPADDSWVETGMIELPNRHGYGETEHRINNYFLENPDRVLGEQLTDIHGRYGQNDYTVRMERDTPMGQRLDTQLMGAVRGSRAPSMQPYSPPPPPAPDVSEETEGRYVVRDGKLQVEGNRRGQIVYDDPKGLSAEDRTRVTDLVGIRDAARALVTMESTGEFEENEIEATREELRDRYLAYVEKHGGALNHPANIAHMGLARDSSLLFSLERYDNDAECWTPASILYERVIGATPSQTIATPQDALIATLTEKGTLDFEHMAVKLGRDDPEAVRDTLAETGLIFRDPAKGKWETHANYLSGDVRQKLREAQVAASGDPSFQSNVNALEGVQPPWVGSEDIEARLGAPWIGDEYVNRWIIENMGIRHPGRGEDLRFFAYDPDFGRWRKRWNFPRDQRGFANAQWGTPDVGAQDILESLLLGTPLIPDKLTRALSGAEDEEEAKAIQGRIKVIQAKAEEMKRDYSEWLWQDAKRTEKLEEKYNNTFNSTRNRTYDGSHLTFPGMAEKWRRRLDPHQRNAVYRIIEDGTALLAHEVGFGKSATMIASAMERKRLGQINKPMFVVLKPTQQNFANEFMGMYPGARVLVPDEDDFSPEKRQRFISNIATGNWDAVILTETQFERIPLSPKAEEQWIRKDKASLQAALQTIQNDRSQDRSGDTESMAQKAVSTALEARDKKLRDLLELKLRDKETEYFDDLGVDALYVDEADRFKNLPFRTSLGGRGDSIKGLNPGSQSNRAWDMYMKVRYLQDDGEPSVVFATGTPVANSLAEAWTMMRYLDEPGLRQRGLHHFDAFASTFGDMREELEVRATGRYEPTKRFRDFSNFAELKRIFSETADRQIAEDNPTMLAKRPHVVGGERIVVTSPKTPALEEYMAEIQDRADNLPTPPRRHRVDLPGGVVGFVGDDNMLNVSGDARKLSIDPRMLKGTDIRDEKGKVLVAGKPTYPDAAPYPEGKIVQVARNVARIHEAEEPVRGVQLVFLDMGTPKPYTPPDDDESDDAEEREIAAPTDRHVDDLYRILKDRMMAQGVPADEIAFIQDYKSKDAREELFEQARRGDVRVLVGHTDTMGVGVNVQDRVAALHHVDAPWRPRDLEQREGRAIRQGNKVYGPVLDEYGQFAAPGRGVQVYQYVQEGSFDEFMWQGLKEKAGPIHNLMQQRDSGIRKVQEIDEFVLDVSNTMAAASANPLRKREVALTNQVRDLQADKRGHDLSVKSARAQAANLETFGRERQLRVLPRMEQDAAYVASLPADADFSAVVGGKEYDKSAEAGKALADAIKKLKFDPSDAPLRPLGVYKGFAIGGNQLESGYRVVVARPETEQPYSIHFPTKDDIAPEGVMRRINNQIKDIPQKAQELRVKLSEDERTLQAAQQQAGQQWQRAGELIAAEQELADVQSRLARGETGVDENKVYGLQPLPVPSWDSEDVAALRERMAGRAGAVPASVPQDAPPAMDVVDVFVPDAEERQIAEAPPQPQPGPIIPESTPAIEQPDGTWELEYGADEAQRDFESTRTTTEEHRAAGIVERANERQRQRRRLPLGMTEEQLEKRALALTTPGGILGAMSLEDAKERIIQQQGDIERDRQALLQRLNAHTRALRQNPGDAEELALALQRWSVVDPEELKRWDSSAPHTNAVYKYLMLEQAIGKAQKHQAEASNVEQSPTMAQATPPVESPTPEPTVAQSAPPVEPAPTPVETAPDMSWGQRDSIQGMARRLGIGPQGDTSKQEKARVEAAIKEVLGEERTISRTSGLSSDEADQIISELTARWRSRAPTPPPVSSYVNEEMYEQLRTESAARLETALPASEPPASRQMAPESVAEAESPPTPPQRQRRAKPAPEVSLKPDKTTPPEVSLKPAKKTALAVSLAAGKSKGGIDLEQEDFERPPDHVVAKAFGKAGKSAPKRKANGKRVNQFPSGKK